MTAALPARARVVVIGGGIIGASTLYHLAHLGIDNAVLLERDRIASGTTWHAAGIVGQLRDSKAQTELAQYTTSLFKSLEHETGQATGYKENGSLSIALSAGRHELIKRSHSAARRLGVPTHYLSPSEVAKAWPHLRVDDVLGGLFVPSNGQVNPLDVTNALIKGAKLRGAQVFEHTPVIDLTIRDHKIVAVKTIRGEIICDRVVLAAGMWTHDFAKRFGVAVPLQAAEHFYVVTDVIPGLDKATPVLSVADERTYFKEDAGKLLIGGFEAVGKAWPTRGAIPEAFSFDELPPDLEHMAPILEQAYSRVPILANTEIQLFFCGPESFTPDGRAYLGPTPNLAGLFIAAGFNSNGILASGGAGKVVAEWATTGLPPVGMGTLHAQRAMPFQANRRYLRERVTESVGLHMTLHWPGHQMKTARGVRYFPVHDRLIAAGAVMGERSGWEIPLYYTRPDATPPVRSPPTVNRALRPKGIPIPTSVPGFGYQPWYREVERECLAARDNAVLTDLSCYGKFHVTGKDALVALNWVSANDIDVPVGHSVYTHWLNARGGVEADLTVTRLQDKKFLVITGHPSQIRDRAWFRAQVKDQWQVEIHDVTAQYAMYALSGPKSRAILGSLTGDDLSTQSLPFGMAREIDLGLARAWILRRSFYGELGFEVYPSTDFARHVYESLVNAGTEHGMQHSGFLAMNHCRVEKGFVHYGADLTEDDTPIEAGLKFAVAYDKPGGFIGHAALLRLRETPLLTHRLVNLKVRDATLALGPYLHHGEPIWQSEEIVGYVTSGAWGFRVGSSLALASIKCATGISAESLRSGKFAVEVAGVRHAVDLTLNGFYDPTGERLRS